MTRKAGKSAALLEHYQSRPNQDVPVAAAARACGVDPKIASTLAARMAHEGHLVRVKRGVYSYDTGPPDIDSVAFVVRELLAAVERAFGASVAEAVRGKMGASMDLSALSRAYEEVCSIVGSEGGENLLRGLLAKLPPPEKGAILKALGKTS